MPLLTIAFLALAPCAHARGRPEDDLAKAQDLVTRKQYDDAIQVLAQVIRKSPDLFDAAQALVERVRAAQTDLNVRYEQLAKALYEERDVEKALRIIDEVEKIDPNPNPTSRELIAAAKRGALLLAGRNRFDILMDQAFVAIGRGDEAAALNIYLGAFALQGDAFEASTAGNVLKDSVHAALDRVRGLVPAYLEASAALSRDDQALTATGDLGRFTAAQKERLGKLGSFAVAADAVARELARDRDAAPKGDEAATLHVFYCEKAVGGREGREATEGVRHVLSGAFDRGAAAVVTALRGRLEAERPQALATLIGGDWPAARAALQRLEPVSRALVEFAYLAETRQSLDPAYAGYDPARTDGLILRADLPQFLEAQHLYREQAAYIALAAARLDAAGARTPTGWDPLKLVAPVTAVERLASDWSRYAQELRAASPKLGQEAGEVSAAAASALAEWREGAYAALEAPVAEAERRLAAEEKLLREGEQITLAGGVTRTAFYPDRRLPPLSALGARAGELAASVNAALQGAGDSARAGGRGAEASVAALTGLRGRVAAMAARATAAISEARTRSVTAESYRRQGETEYRNAQAAAGRNEFDRARESLRVAAEAYDRSLDAQEDTAVRDVRDRLLPALLAQLNQGENNRVVAQVRALIDSATEAYRRAQFDEAQRQLINAQTRWKDTNTEPNGEIENWLALVRRALSLQEGWELAETQPLYKEIVQLLKFASDDFSRGESLEAQRQPQQAQLAFTAAQEKLDTINLAVPRLKSANFLRLKIMQKLEPAAFARELEQIKGQASSALASGADVALKDSYSTLKDYEQIAPGDRDIARILERLEIALGVRVAPPDPTRIEGSRQKYIEAKRIYDERQRDLYTQAVRLADEAIQLYPGNRDAVLLKDRILIDTGGARQDIISSDDLREFRRAEKLFNDGSFAEAYNTVQILLRKPANRNYPPLLDIDDKLKRRLNIQWQRIAALLALVCLASLRLAAQVLYWEDPQLLVADGARFPHAASGGGLAAVVWQEFEANRVWLSLRTSRDLDAWVESRRFAGPFAYQGEQAPLFSLEVDAQGRITVAVASADRETTVLYSADGGARFTATVFEAPVTTIAPRLSRRADGTLFLFVNYDQRDSLAIYYTVLDPNALTAGGRQRRSFLPLAREQALVFNFLPAHASFGGREFVVYQSQDTSRGQANFQLWLRESDRNGEFRDPPIPLTAFSESSGATQAGPELFDNQRPSLTALSDRLALVWERRKAGGPKQVAYMELDADGRPIRSADSAAGVPYTRVTETAYECLFPQAFAFRDRLYVMWFDNRRGQNHVFVAERDGRLWRERDLTARLDGSSIYPYVVEPSGRIAVLWENQLGGHSRLALGGPDQSTAPPQLFAQGFTPGLPSRVSRPSFAWSVPRDASGISGFAWSWSEDPAQLPEKRLMLSADTPRASVDATADGKWYFRVAALDFAGNWSAPATMVFERDMQPPAAVVYAPQPVDNRGFVASNSPLISWKPADGKPISGYAYDMQRLSADARAPQPAAPPRPAAAAEVRTQATVRPYDNLDDGLWAFSVRAVDLAGNVSAPSVLYLRLNKYVPVTIIGSVDWSKDDFGRLSLTIRGRGFTEDGKITEVVLDRDGKEPLDYRFPAGEFRLESDRLIDGVALSRYDEGNYRVGLVHSRRGITFTPPLLALGASGTVKLGDFSAAAYTPPWESGSRPRLVVPASRLIVWLSVMFMAFVMLASANRVVAVAVEGRDLRRRVAAVVHGGGLLEERVMRELKSKGMSLRIKFTLLIVVLVILIVLMVSVPLSISMVETQTRNLAEGLDRRTRVLLGSMSAAAGRFLIDQEALSLANLTNQIDAMPEAEFATITGITPRDSNRPGSGEEYVWATNDKGIDAKIGGGELDNGKSVLKDDVSPLMGDLSRKINATALSDVGGLSQELKRVVDELGPIFGRTDPQSQARVSELGKIQQGLEARINAQLQRIGSGVASVPAFQWDNLRTDYTFYQPIVFRRPDSDIYFRGLVRLRVSATSILDEIARTTQGLYRTIGLIALAAIGLGAVGALILASITIGPIRKLAEGVARIRDTEDKEQLKDHRIEIRQKDEIRALADNINEMTQGLVKAAIASKDLTVGKEIQKMFIPLDVDETGAKGTTGYESNEAVEIFGYYEGAKGVSGDYFDYKRLDADHYAMIKCDVAGKGVPAALIMIEVATIFQTYFKSWTLKSPGMRIDRFAYDVNDMLEERGFKGRFATLMVAIVNIRTGVCVMVNAGDNIVHIYSARERRMVIKRHPNPPAAGVFPSVMLQVQSGFKPVSERLEAGDTLFLITDGIEEAQRLFRGDGFRAFSLEKEEQLPDDGEIVSFAAGSSFEQLGIGRIQRIVRAVFCRQTYDLRKLHDPSPDAKYVFDFSSCQGSVEDAVLALIAVEKVFRLYADPSAGPGDVVTVDRKVDDFLKAHFVQQGLYFGHPLGRGTEPGHVSYSHLREDAQYDDLTILAVRKK